MDGKLNKEIDFYLVWALLFELEDSANRIHAMCQDMKKNWEDWSENVKTK